MNISSEDKIRLKTADSLAETLDNGASLLKLLRPEAFRALLAKWNKETEQGFKSDSPMSDAINSYLEERERMGISAFTSRKYKSDLNYLSSKKLNSSPDTFVKAFKESTAGKSKSTVTSKAAASRTFFNWLIAKGAVKSNPFDKEL